MKAKLLISFVIDNSAAVQGEKFEKIKAALMNYEKAMKESDVDNIEIEIVTFNDFDPIVINKFGDMNIDYDNLNVFRMPFLGKAIDLVLQDLLKRVEFYNTLEVPLYKPWLFVLTDAYSFDDLEEIAKKIKQHVAENKLLYMPFMLSKKKIPTNIEPLLSTKKFMRIKENTYDLFFNWFFNMTTKRANTELGESVKFDRSGFEGWAVI